MKKKLFAVIMMVCLILAGCSSDTKEETKADDNKSDTATITEQADASETETEKAERFTDLSYAGVYYDIDEYNRSGVFYGIVLRSNGEALVCFQDMALGTWAGEEITVPDWLEVIQFTPIENNIFLPSYNNQEYVRADAYVIPADIAAFYTYGTIPSSMSLNEVSLTGDQYMGKYTDAFNNLVEIGDYIEGGNYSIHVSVVKLCDMQGVCYNSNGNMEFSLYDGEDTMEGVFYTVDGMSYTLRITYCSWNDLANDEYIEGFAAVR